MISGKECHDIAHRLQNLLTDRFWILRVDQQQNGLEVVVTDFAGDLQWRTPVSFEPCSDVRYGRHDVQSSSFAGFCAGLHAVISSVEQPSPEAVYLHSAAQYAGNRIINGVSGARVDYIRAREEQEHLELPAADVLERLRATERRAIDDKITALACTKHYYEDLQIEGLQHLRRFKIRRDGIWSPAFSCGDVYTTNYGAIFRKELEKYAAH